ncbi:cytochrome ubiquinol oxidase subunit I [Gilvimarinus sp. SDUM040013]|uniref:Cytochrome ubiquinol oxidase subunit I n=1 Tax=Gilvimarinus gilvus TaxID=3058038 RepID=A0ABU4S276_9GAMM|nr:cytochrome ubiquinol oxidase subunit I [Gilvimarinus sp. SDUM040013]MDO3384956.1 cytochrome ubiquinol oxidase subunit I [Gilvimarinus sp. SDUM040013]MDX6851248.1 cytochrome ubiquinol oxidase subunit I [Gilvimarinus sp. SDUM040013]
MLDTLMLSRIQFALNISFHILFPTITIALCWALLFFKLRANITGDDTWNRIYRFWVKIFALTFALGVVSGITMSFQFGTNWPGFMEKVGNVAGPLLGYEVLTAFFLEATFLGVMLFGGDKVSNRVHTLATFMVAIGTTLSAFWILALNSWMHTPAGHVVRDGVVYPESWLAIIFNPSFPYRFVHMMLASSLTCAFLIAGVSAYRLLRGDDKPGPRYTLKFGLVAVLFLAPAQALVGDFHGLNTLQHQPAKIAAMEGIWHTERGAPLLLFALPDSKQKTNHFEIGIPKGASLILTHDLDGEIKGLNEFADAHPPVAPVFFSFRVMVGMGVLMILVGIAGCWTLYRRGQLYRWQLRVLLAMTFAGWLATLAGWYVTEIGRQPFIVSGILRTRDAVTDQPPEFVWLSLITYAIVYACLLWAYIHTLFLMARKAAQLESFSDARPTQGSPTKTREVQA